MKKILAISLLAGFVGSLFAQAGTQPRESQPIVVEGGEQGPQTTPVVRTVTTKKAYAVTQTVPETVTTVQAPERVLVREGLLSWLSIGLRASADYHVTPKDGSMSCLWFFGEWYNTAWGLQAGVGYLWMPVTSYKDTLGTTYTGVGSRGYVTFDFIGKYYWWFARSWWVGAGVNYAALLGGQLKYYDPTVAPGSNPLTPVATPAYWADVAPGGGLFYAQIGTGLRIALGNAFNVVNFEPEVRVLIPLTTPYNNTYGAVVRLNLGFSYAFGL
ncbi:MAG: hypothetical protein U1F40_11000 [Turneriella sp.]